MCSSRSEIQCLSPDPGAVEGAGGNQDRATGRVNIGGTDTPVNRGRGYYFGPTGLTRYRQPRYVSAMSRIRNWRNAQSPKISQVELAERLGTTQSHVSEIENSEDLVTLDLAAKVFAVTGVRIGRLKDATDQQARTVAKVAGAA